MASNFNGNFVGDGSGVTNVNAQTLDGLDSTAFARTSNFTGQFKYLGTGVNYDIARETKVSGGIAVYSAYNAGSNRPTTYDTSMQIVASNRGFEIAADWISTNSTALFVRSLRDCCQDWSSWTRIMTNQYGAFQVNITTTGSVTASGDVTAYSDARLKTDVVNISNALDKVTQLRGVMYTKDGAASTGVIAQEVEEVLPEVVHTADDEMGTKSVAYGNMVGLLIEAIKELKSDHQEQIDALKAEIAALKGM